MISMLAKELRKTSDPFVLALGKPAMLLVEEAGRLSMFFASMLRSLAWQKPALSNVFRCFYQIGVLSLPVVMITGGFIGMVLAVQTYDQFRLMHLESRLGAVINISLVKELGPVLAAMMLAGRVGTSMAAQLGTMRVTEQIDALRTLGADPLSYLVVPRFLACLLLIPLLTAVADVVGILGGWFFCANFLSISSFDYWHYALNYVTAYDVATGLVKSIFFGGVIAMVSCHRGFHCQAGAEGVGRAATESFVTSFVMILIADFFLGVFFQSLYYLLWPAPVSFVNGGSLEFLWKGFC